MMSMTVVVAHTTAFEAALFPVQWIDQDSNSTNLVLFLQPDRLALSRFHCDSKYYKVSLFKGDMGRLIIPWFRAASTSLKKRQYLSSGLPLGDPVAAPVFIKIFF